MADWPLFFEGKVKHGYNRGSKQLGIPTANLPDEVACEAGKKLESGIYYGYARVFDSPDSRVFPMVMSFGWNPVFDNPKRTAEVHIIHQYENDFYDETLKVAVCGYIRPELKFSSIDELISAIHRDIEFARQKVETDYHGAAVLPNHLVSAFAACELKKY